jgi:hypothetical protein
VTESCPGSQKIRGQVCPGFFLYKRVFPLSLERGVIIIKLRKMGIQKYLGYPGKLPVIIP